MKTLDILDKIKGLNGDIIGCVVRQGDAITGNMPGEYAERDFELITDDLKAMFTVLDSFDPAPEVQHFMLDFPAHKVYVRKIEDGFLAVFNLNLERVSFRKLQVATTLHVDALETSLKPAEPEAVADEPVKKKSGGLRAFLRPTVETPARPPEPEKPAAAVTGSVSKSAPEPVAAPKKKKRMYRGVEY